MVEEHPQYRAWNEALERLVEAERRYHIALMERQANEEIHFNGRDLDEARERYRVIAEKVEREDARGHKPRTHADMIGNAIMVARGSQTPGGVGDDRQLA